MWWKRHNWIPLLLLISGNALAHPVAFKGAWSFMAFNQPDMLDWQLLYSFHRKFSLGVDYFRDTMEGQPRYFLIPRVSWLVNRWYGADSQGNIYVYGGIGAAKKSGADSLAAEGAIEADYETREIYFSGKALVVAANGFDTLTMYQLRAGFAPYVGEFEDLHTWLILQGQYFPNAVDERLRVGPVMRFFYNNVLWELGVTTQGSWNFNFMVHF